jgi:hypothetical protein
MRTEDLLMGEQIPSWGLDPLTGGERISFSIFPFLLSVDDVAFGIGISLSFSFN